jgi:ribosomal protein L29
MGKRTLNTMRAKEMHQMSSDELRTIIANARLELMKLVGLSRGKHEAPTHPRAIKENKKAIARAMTILVKRGERCS